MMPTISGPRQRFFSPKNATTTSCTRRVASLYWYLAFPCLVWVGLSSLRALDQAISLDRAAQQTSPNNNNHITLIQQQRQQVSKEKVFPGFHNRDPSLRSVGVPPNSIIAQENNKNRSGTRTGSESVGDHGVSPNNWYAKLEQQQPKHTTTTSGVMHPEFVQKLNQRRLELERKAATNTDGSASQKVSPETSNKKWTPAPTPLNQTISFGDCFLPPPRIPPPVKKNSSRSSSSSTTVVILVLSAHHNFERRQAIRETWAQQQQQQQQQQRQERKEPSNGNVLIYFVVGHSNCDASDASADGKNNSNNMDCLERDHSLLLQEQLLYQDILEIPMIESYRRLPEKVVQAYHWTLQHIPTAQWFVKADDDTYVRPNSLYRYLLKYNSHIPIWIGKMIPHSRVARTGKWAETKEFWEGDYYPYWAIGSAGHVVSRAVAQYVVENSASLHRYQGEDVSLGIWLHHWQQQQQQQQQQQKQQQMGMGVTYIQADHMITNDGTGACGIANYFLIGHDLTLEEIYDCYLRFNNHTSFLQENTWVDEPAAFADLVRVEETAESNVARNAFIRNHLSKRDGGDGGSGAGSNIFQNGGARSSYNNYGAAVPRGKKIGYEFPGSFRDHLAKAS